MGKNVRDLREKRRQEDAEDDQRYLPEDQRISREGTGSLDLANKLQELLDRAQPLVEQVNGLYNQYFSGVEQRPPTERRKHLDQLMETLSGLHKGTVQSQFRYQNILSSYTTYKLRWDKQTKAIESGRVKRPAGPKRVA